MKVTVTKKDNAVPVVIHTEFIKLQDAMKYANIVYSGGEAKQLILDEQVKVNGTPANIKFISAYENATVTETGTVKSGIAKQ